jgi:hypothetical protein
MMIIKEAITFIVNTKHSIAFLAGNITLRWVLLINHYLTILSLPTTPNTSFSLLDYRKMVARNQSIG